MSTHRHGGKRWPLHPRPEPGEALSSWLERTARLYGMSVAVLLRHNLGSASALLGDAEAASLDWDPPTAVLTALGERTGVPPGELRRMTMAGWVPWLTDTLDAGDHRQAVFDTYVRQDSVLLAPGEAGCNTAQRFRTWRGPWLPAHPLRRVCPECAKDPQRGTALMWRLPIMTGCATHACRLEPERDVNLAAHGLAPLIPASVDPLVVELDRRTHEGVTTGMVTLPGRAVHVGVWFRLLRTLLDEVSMSLSRVGVRSRLTLERVWQATGRPVRAGLTVWRPYEQLDWPLQEAMLHAAAVALRLAADRRIAPRGTLGSALAEPPHERVYDGDDPRPRMAVPDLTTAVDAWLATARTGPEPAGHLLRLLTAFDPSPANFAKQLHFLISQAGIPAEFLRPERLSQ
ncbi:TniQ protein [Kribbella sp. VKM Ac-2527]|uniref:TniQ protein n=1 Tax=Kribbella caucasensis TaxID=2512215 RepID=A0A4R6J5W7_9ACTN|nr:TniQ family protein [Kribbella sp. VKM Ac-2527]TDO30241.1 TniQ protein [Kribbella sp. VKM Ac-2527]